MAISLPQHTANLLALCYDLDLGGRKRIMSGHHQYLKILYKLLSIVLATSLFFASTQAGEKAAISNKINWATASEVDNFGFDVFRSENEERTCPTTGRFWDALELSARLGKSGTWPTAGESPREGFRDGS